MTRHILLVCGSRDWSDVQRIADELASYPMTCEVMHGAARGADAIAGTVAGSWGWKVHARPADWDRLGKRAGPVRNGEMAAELAGAMAEGAKMEGLAFGALDREGKRTGTGDMVARLRRIGVQVRWVPTPEGEAQEIAPMASESPGRMGAIRVASARLSYRGPGALCVARDIVDRALAAGKPAPGAAFAPTRALLAMVLPARQAAEELLDDAGRLEGARAVALEEQALRIEAEAWARYRPLYLAGMLISSGTTPPPGWEPRVAMARELGFVPASGAWAALPALATAIGGRLVFTCFCGQRWRHHCHSRTLCEILARRGAVDEGEWAPVAAQTGLPGV